MSILFHFLPPLFRATPPHAMQPECFLRLAILSKDGLKFELGSGEPAAELTALKENTLGESGNQTGRELDRLI